MNISKQSTQFLFNVAKKLVMTLIAMGMPANAPKELAPS